MNDWILCHPRSHLFAQSMCSACDIRLSLTFLELAVLLSQLFVCHLERLREFLVGCTCRSRTLSFWFDQGRHKSARSCQRNDHLWSRLADHSKGWFSYKTAHRHLLGSNRVFCTGLRCNFNGSHS
ncbi:MAG: hypothetical protein [Circular genetic element sp.]|nr:MAG: hypothetical protein [Circular genetic element sp.]